MKNLFIPISIILVLLLVSCSPKTPAIDPAVHELGEKVFQANCSGCHSLNYDVVLVGPSMLGIADRAANMVEGMDAYTYLEQSILEPSAFLNEGFMDLMPPTYRQSLTPQEVDAVIQYILILEK
ncbi:MAG: cytochrome c [Anaerolineales bacterium]|nr:cytochrome c [Anaerolineales bacterium]